MRELLDELAGWRAQGRPVVLARVIDVDGSGPRGPGAALAVNGDGEVIGSVSGGCVDGAVVTEALDILAGAGEDARMVSFGYSDEDAFSVGLTCGGVVYLYLERLVDAAPDEASVDGLRAAIAAHRNAVLVTVVAGPGTGDKVLLVDGGAPVGRLADPDLHRVVVREAEGVLASGATSLRHLGVHGQTDLDEVTVFVEAYAPPRACSSSAPPISLPPSCGWPRCWATT